MKRIEPILLAVVVGIMCRAANAGSASAGLPVTATVPSACATRADSTAFAAYTVGAGPTTGSTTITVKCSPGLGFKLALGPGATSGGALGQSLASNGLPSLEYNLYSISGLSSLRRAGGAGVTLLGLASNDGLSTSLTVFADVSDNGIERLATPGIDSGVVTITVTY